MDREDVVAKLSALAHAGRLDIFRLLMVAGRAGLPAGEVARRLDVAPTSLSANLKVLTHAGLIKGRRDGRSIIYSADYAQMTALLGFLLEDCCAGEAAICAPLTRLLANPTCYSPAQLEIPR